MIVDAGGSLAPRNAIAPDERDQRVAKAGLIAKSWALGGIDGMALSQTDWALGEPVLTALIAEHRLPVLAANLTCNGAAFPGGKVVEAGGLRVGIVGVTEGAPEGACTMSEPIAAARAAIEALGPVDVMVALMPLTGTAVADWDRADLPVDLVIDASGRHLDEPDQNGVGYLLSSGSRGKHLGFASLETVPGAKGWAPRDVAAGLKEEVTRLEQRIEGQKQRIERATDEVAKTKLERQLAAYDEQLRKARESVAAAEVATAPTHLFGVRIDELGAEVPDHAATKVLVDAMKAAMEAGGGQVAAGAPVTAVARVVPHGSPFAGSDTCKGCHPAQTAQWETTGHAKAWASLTAQSRSMDLECYGCHVTGHGAEGGPSAPDKVGGLRDVQCESCHGPAAKHVVSPATVKPTREPAQAVCTSCHDGEKDEGRFDYAVYLPKVKH